MSAPTTVHPATTDKAAVILALLCALAPVGCESTTGGVPNGSVAGEASGGAGGNMTGTGEGASGGMLGTAGGGAREATGGMATTGAAPGGAGAGGTTGGQTAVCPFGRDEYFLWSGTAPGSEGAALTEVWEERSNNPDVKDRSLTGVSSPSVFAYLADKPNGAAAVVAPGGGYTRSAFDKEGVDIALWLNSVGVSAFVLKYRLPGEFPGKGYVALADAQRALRTVRKLGGACGIDPARIGVVGFSAGGHLASQLETRPSAETTPAADDIDALDARPNFGILMYPVVSMDPAIAHAGSKKALLGASPTAAEVTLASSELQVTAQTPPTFIGVPKSDTVVKPENSVRMDTALATARVAHELHQYNDGSHGVAIRNATGDIAMWPVQAAAWLKTLKLTP